LHQKERDKGDIDSNESSDDLDNEDDKRKKNKIDKDIHKERP
jgi:hypothetical protein